MPKYDDFPLLNLSDIRRDSDEALRDMAYYVEGLQAESEGHYPPDAAKLLEDIAALRLQLGALFSPALKQAMDEEEQAMQDEADRWEPSSY